MIRRGQVHRQRAGGTPPGGILRHKGWRATKVDLPALAGKQDTDHHRSRRNRNRVENLRTKYVIGIDLGTTNSALAYAELRADADPFAPAAGRAAGRSRSW